MQLNLFTNKTCSVCGCNPGIKRGNPLLWNGFLDRDLMQHCCYKCRDKFYQGKAKQLKLPAGKMIYSEMPEVI